MTDPLTATEPLTARDWYEFKVNSIFRGCKWDFQRGDHSVVARYALQLDRDHWDVISRLAELLSQETLEFEAELLMRRQELLGELGLPRALLTVLKAMRGGGAPAVRVMRFDFHFTTDGWRISEVNSDVPGGFVESSLFAGQFAGLEPPGDPSAALANAVALHAPAPGAQVGMVHATAYTDDRQVMEHLAGKLRALGLRTAILSPAHIRLDANSGAARIESRFVDGTPFALVRFFPAEWLPTLGGGESWRGFFECRAVLANPATAILSQTKRGPIVWDRMSCPMKVWRALLPEVRQPDHSNRSNEDWILKPALGRAGEDIGMPGVTAAKELSEIRKATRRQPDRWIAQRRFEAVLVNTPDGLRSVCAGVFTIDGRACGCYGRVSSSPLINAAAQDIAILLKSPNS